MYIKLRDRTELYFNSFMNKDLNSLSKLFDEKITLFDPIVKEVIGKENVLNVNKNIFNNCSVIKYSKKELHIDSKKNIVTAEIEFYCDEQKINVVDIITYNSKFKIIKITAYLDSKTLK